VGAKNYIKKCGRREGAGNYGPPKNKNAGSGKIITAV